MPNVNSETVEITLTTLTYGGEALGRLAGSSGEGGGRAVFVAFGLPGERVRVRLLEGKRGFARGEIVEVLEAAPQRVAPRCRHFGLCGGCHYQHIPYALQVQWKAEILRDQLQRIGKLASPPVRPARPAPQAWNYRNHIQFHLTREGKLGFIHARGDGILPVVECHLPQPELASLWPGLEFEAGSGLARVALRAGQENEVLLILESETPAMPELESQASLSVVHVYKEHPVVMAGREWVSMRILGEDFRVSATSFFQVNTRMAEKMVEHILEILPFHARETLLELYCGVGLFSRFLAPRYGRLIGIESSAAACQDFAINLDEYEHVELYAAAAEEVLPALVGQLPASTEVLVDPPRAGLEPRVLEALLRLRPGVIVYVSCDPSTLARDAARLMAGGYGLKQVTPFDLFPQTYHIESISVFERS